MELKAIMLSTGIPSALLLLLLVLAIRHDMAARRIPNWLVLAGLLAGVACNSLIAGGTGLFAADAGGLGLTKALLGALTGLALMLPLYALGAMGAGDAKLMAAVGAFLGPLQVGGAALLTFVAGGVLSLLAALWSRSLIRVLNNLRLIGMLTVSGRDAGLSLEDVQTTGRLPYAIAIATGTALQVGLAAHGRWMFA